MIRHAQLNLQHMHVFWCQIRLSWWRLDRFEIQAVGPLSSHRRTKRVLCQCYGLFCTQKLSVGAKKGQ
jgi:hypothetical protein